MRSIASTRFANDAAAAVAAVGIGLFFWATIPPKPQVDPASKAADRLAATSESFVQEEVPVRRTRVFDAVAMFAIPQAEPAPWSDRLVPTMAALEPARQPAVERRPSVPRIVTAAAETGLHAVALPPVRPDNLAGRPPAPVQPITHQAEWNATAAAPAQPTSPRRQAREQIVVLGWAVPGSQHLPTRRDAVTIASRIGGGVADVGDRAIDTVGSAGANVGRGVVSASNSVLEFVGLD